MKIDHCTTTENGAPSLSTTSSSRLDLFFGGLVRGAPGAKLRQQVRASWAESAEDTLALLMHARDAREGKGERKVVRQCLLWLRKHKPKTFLKNLRAFVELGYFKDLTQLAVAVHRCKLPALGAAGGELAELELFAEVLGGDLKSLQSLRQAEAEEGKQQEGEELEGGAGGAGGEGEKGGVAESKQEEQDAPTVENPRKRERVSISLAAKWAPTEGTSFDKKAKLAKRLARLLFPGEKAPQRAYRKAIGQLRSHLKVVERSMCAGEWEDINFSAVPAKAHKNLKEVFRKHQEERYGKYLSDLEEGKNGAKINCSGLQPHELVKEYLVQNKAEDATSEAQWRALVGGLKQAGTFESCLAVVDVSGSMSGTPMEVAIAMGLVVSELSAEPFRGRLLTFHANPTWHTVRGGSLKERVSDVSRMSWGMNTDIEKVFDLILQQAKQHKLGSATMPKTLYIFSDMQFDQASTARGTYATTHARAQAKFQAQGYQLPQIVYWNLRGDTADFPTSANTPGVAMVSGFSAQLLKLFLAGGQLSPLAVMRQAIEPYGSLVMVEEEERAGGGGGEQGGGGDSDLDSETEVEAGPAAKRRKLPAGRGGRVGGRGRRGRGRGRGRGR